MRLKKILLQHFKGLKKVELIADGKNVTVRGENGTGKTSIVDAYAWCLTGKGFDGKTIDTQIKLRGEDGSIPNDGGVEHSVEVTFTDDTGRDITFCREFKEKWEKHRGQADSEFKGHTTNYSIDGVPMAKKEYERRMGELINGDALQFLSMPLHFCTGTKWQDRRKMLMEMSGTVTNEAIIKENPSLEPLASQLEKNDISDIRKVIQSKMKKNNEEIKNIPARIDELEDMKGDVAGLDAGKIAEEIKALTSKVQDAQGEIANLQNGGGAAETRNQLAEVEAKRTKYVAEYEADYNRKASEAERTVNGCRSEIERIGAEVERLQNEAERCETFAKTQDKLAENLRNEWAEVQAREYVDKVSDTCPCCGQKLPADRIEEIRVKELEQFNLSKADHLKAIREKGKRIMADKEADVKKAENCRAQMEDKTKRLDELTKSLEEAEKMLEGIGKPDVTKEPEYIQITEEIGFLQRVLESNQADPEKVAALNAQIDEYSQQIAELQSKLAAIKQNENIEARIEELKDRETTLGKLYSNLEQQLFLTEEFLRAKVRATEDSINTHFQYVKFKMFEQRINGSLEECCEPMIDGVPFSDGLNKGNRMRAALDIVQALGKYFKATLPVWIDDCESYTSLPPIDAQLIKLIADGGHKALSFEIED